MRGLNSCMMRKADIERYCRALIVADHVMVDTADEAEVILVWTCAFRQDFRDASADVVRNYHDQYPDKRVIATGCLPDIDPEYLAHRFKGTVIPWRKAEQGLSTLFDVGGLGNRLLAEAPLPISLKEYQETHPEVKTTHCDQFIKLFISEGCPFNCTYCAEIRAFPKFQSFPMDRIVADCLRVVRHTGNIHVVLHGDCLGEYGRDFPDGKPTFSQLLAKLRLAIPDIRIGLRNMHPASLLASWRMVSNYLMDGTIFLLETPIQSANDRVLGMMARGYTKDQIDLIFKDLSITNFSELETHVIAGFPSETPTEFQETVEFLLRWQPKYVLVSGFMAAPGSVAAQMAAQVPPKEIRRRVLSACEQLEAAGIIVNHDSCDLCKKRFEHPLVDGLFV